jgi:hypothetical protein
MTNPLKLLSLLAFAGLIFLGGCNSGQSGVVRLTPTANLELRPASINFEQPTGQSSDTLPTPTSTRVVTYDATATVTTVPDRPSSTPPSEATPTVAPQRLSPPTPTPTPSPQIRHVVIISLDGLRPDAWPRADTPNLDALRRRGAYSDQAKAVLPSVTLINHASMLGGMTPAKHGIDWNDNEPARGQINGPTLFSVTHEAGLSTAMVVGKDKLQHLVLSNSVDTFTYAGFVDSQVADDAVALIGQGLPNVLFIHFPNIDTAGHLTGWMSAGQLAAVGLADTAVGRVVAALDSGGHMADTLLLVTADHGGSGTAHGSDSAEDTTIPWLAVGPGAPPDATLTSPIITYDTAATALHALNLPIPDSWDGHPVLEIFR